MKARVELAFWCVMFVYVAWVTTKHEDDLVWQILGIAALFGAGFAIKDAWRRI